MAVDSSFFPALGFYLFFVNRIWRTCVVSFGSVVWLTVQIQDSCDKNKRLMIVEKLGTDGHKLQHMGQVQ